MEGFCRERCERRKRGRDWKCDFCPRGEKASIPPGSYQKVMVCASLPRDLNRKGIDPARVRKAGSLGKGKTQGTIGGSRGSMGS